MSELNLTGKNLSEREAAAWLGVSRIHLVRLRTAGKIKFYRVGARILYSPQHLADYLASVESQAAA